MNTLENESWADKLSRLAEKASDLFAEYWRIRKEQGDFTAASLFAKQAWQKALKEWEDHGASS